MFKLPVISLWNPYPFPVMFGISDISIYWQTGQLDKVVPVDPKDTENRSWTPPHWLIGQRLGIHASKTFDRHYTLPEGIKLCEYVELGLRQGTIFTGCILGTVRLDGYVRMVNGAPSVYPHNLEWPGSRWWEKDQVGWIFSDPKPFPAPIPINGKQRIWYANVPDHYLKEEK